MVQEKKDIYRLSCHHDTQLSYRHLEMLLLPQHGYGERRSLRCSPDIWPICSRSHYVVQVCDEQTGKKEKQMSLSIMRRVGTKTGRGRTDCCE